MFIVNGSIIRNDQTNSLQPRKRNFLKFTFSKLKKNRGLNSSEKTEISEVDLKLWNGVSLKHGFHLALTSANFFS